MTENLNEKWMRAALQEARTALKKKEVPVGYF
jgi:tRNA(Arg) A34 adenosine deaminase TadA